MSSKSILARSDLDLFLNWVSLKASTITTFEVVEKGGEVNIDMDFHGESTSFKVNCNVFY